MVYFVLIKVIFYCPPDCSDKQNAGDRKKFMTLCNIDINVRNVVANLIAQKVGATLYFNVKECFCNFYILKKNEQLQKGPLYSKKNCGVHNIITF